MDLDTNNLIQQYLEVEKNFVMPNCKGIAFNDNYTLKLIEKITKKIRERSLIDKIDQYDYECRLSEMHSFIDNLHDALNGSPLKSDEKKECHEIWYHRTQEQIIGFKNIDKEYFINKEELIVALEKYLSNPWLQLDQIDWIFLDSLVFDEIEAYRESIYSGKIVGKENWNYVVARGDLNKFNLLEAKKALLFISLAYILPLSIIFTLFYLEKDIAIIPTIGFIIFIVSQAIYFPFRFIKKKKIYKSHLERLKKMVQIYHYCKPPVISLLRINQCLNEAINCEVNFEGAFFALFKKIMSDKGDFFLPYA